VRSVVRRQPRGITYCTGEDARGKEAARKAAERFWQEDLQRVFQQQDEGMMDY